MQLKIDPQSPEAGILSRFMAAIRHSVASLKSTVTSLPGKLLLLTVAFVMLAEVLIFVPSIANFRVNWLLDRLTAARIASLAADAAPGGQVPERLRDDLLASANVRAIAVKTDGRRRLILAPQTLSVIDASFDLRPMQDMGVLEGLSRRVGLIGEALYVFLAPNGRKIRVYGQPALKTGDPTVVEVILDENALCEDMLRHALNILILSIINSIIAAALVYLTLIRVLVDPMMRITNSMLRFSESPEDPERIITHSGRSDEIGVAERELAEMQSQVAQALTQKNRLAQLGLAVSKINHDLRNMLASAQLISDRLGTVQDPTVQRFAPKLIASLDRAIDFCNSTLKFGRAEEAAPRRELIPVASLLQEVADGLDVPRDRVDWQVDLPEALRVDADREHLYRVLNNIVRNAIDALEAIEDGGCITVTGSREGLSTRILIRDDGPGIPEKARRNLFKAFQGNARKGGTGLGLTIAHELVQAHGGRLRLLDEVSALTDQADNVGRTRLRRDFGSAARCDFRDRDP